MSTRRHFGPLRALLVALMIVPTAAVLGSIPWLKQQPDAVGLALSGAAAVTAVAASVILAIMHDRGLDEWERSNARFATQWGWTAGVAVVALLLALPPFRDLLVASVADWADAPGIDQKIVVIAFVGGFAVLAVVQTICTALLSLGWAFWKSRPS